MNAKTNEVSLFPAPPDHFKLFADSPEALTPPSAELLAGAEFFPSFGRPVPNIKHKRRQIFEPPVIDSDVLMYNREAENLGGELQKIAQLFPAAIDELFNAVIREPETVNRPLRQIDNLVKNIFHICEIARNMNEPYAVAIALAKQRLEEKRKMRDSLMEAIEAAEKVLEEN